MLGHWCKPQKEWTTLSEKKWSKNLGIANDMIYKSQEKHFKSLLYRSLKFDKTRNNQNVVARDEQQKLTFDIRNRYNLSTQ